MRIFISLRTEGRYNFTGQLQSLGIYDEWVVFQLLWVLDTSVDCLVERRLYRTHSRVRTIKLSMSSIPVSQSASSQAWPIYSYLSA